jgi:cell division transport system permease protein
MKIHLKTAWSYIRRSPFQALAASFVLTLTFFVATLVSVLVYSSSKLITYFATRPQVIVFLKNDASDTDISALQNKLSLDIHVKDIRYVSKEDALSIYKKSTSDNPLLGQLVSPSIFPPSLEFSVTDLSFAQSLIDEVKTEKIVESVGFTAALGGETSLSEVIGRLKTITTYVRIGGIVFVGLLGMTSLVVLLIITSLRVVARREEVEILNLIGATESFIRKPIIIEAFIYTLFGVFLGWAISFIAVLYLAPSIVTYFGEIPILPRNALGIFELFGIILAGELLVGTLLALSGSLAAISRVKKAR